MLTAIFTAKNHEIVFVSKSIMTDTFPVFLKEFDKILKIKNNEKLRT